MQTEIAFELFVAALLVGVAIMAVFSYFLVREWRAGREKKPSLNPNDYRDVNPGADHIGKHTVNAEGGLDYESDRRIHALYENFDLTADRARRSVNTS